MVIWEKHYPRERNIPDPKLSKEHLPRFNRVNKLPIVHNLLSLAVHIRREGEVQLQWEQASAQGHATGPYPRSPHTGANICLGWSEPSSNTKLCPNIPQDFLGHFCPVFCKLSPNSHFLCPLFRTCNLLWSHISRECILYPAVLLKKSRDLNYDPCVGPEAHTSHPTSLPSYFWFQGQVINAGISSACP